MTELQYPDSSRAKNQVRLYGQLNMVEAYEIRDFLSRSVVEFDWIELTNDEDCHRELGLATLSNIRLPVVEFPDGTRMFSPTVRSSESLQPLAKARWL